MSRNYLSKNNELRKGDFLLSNNREWKAVFQDDGNFVIYGWKPVWATDTDGLDAFSLRMQTDCNLAIHNKEGKPIWATQQSCPGSEGTCSLHLTNDGRLVVSKDTRAAAEIWSSAKCKGKKL